MKTFNELEHMRVYKQPLIVPYKEDDKKKETVVQILSPNEDEVNDIINTGMKNPHLIEGYYMNPDVMHLINNKEEALEEAAGFAAGAAAGAVATRVATDVAVKYGEKYINAKKAVTPTQKKTAAKVFQREYDTRKKYYERWDRRGRDRAFTGITPDAWWISWFGVKAEDIKRIGSNEKNKFNSNVFNSLVAKVSKKVSTEMVDEFKAFIKDKDFFLISNGVEDTGAVPFDVKYLYCTQTGKIYKYSQLVSLLKLDFKHPMSIEDYLNRSKKSMLEIKDVLDICKGDKE